MTVIPLLLMLIILAVVETQAIKECKTPTGEKGTCISIYSCQEYLDVVVELNSTQFEYLKKAQCGFDKTAFVCCPTRGQKTKPLPIENDFLKNSKYCGYQHFDDYFSNTPQTANIDEFPWLASLIFFDGVNRTSILCGGALISDRYVLTAAHCTNPRETNLVRVRLGEYNLVQDKDCTQISELGEECTDPVKEFGISEIIRHPEYSLRTKENDIALIRINKSVTFSDYIRPVCLPHNTKLADVGDVMTISGWGAASFGGKQVDVKKKILVELLSLDECQKFYSNRNNRIKITPKQICTKGRVDSSQSSCQGDSGGPVLFANKNQQWHVQGIVSFGYACDNIAPDVNTNVISYLGWIVENIKP